MALIETVNLSQKYEGREVLKNINLKVEKMIKIGDIGRIYFSGDFFNALNVYETGA